MNKKLSISILLALFLSFPVLVRGEALSEPASLREKVALDALGYIRIPNPWGLLASPKDSVLSAALKNESHVRQIERLQASVYENLLKKAGPAVQSSLALLLHHLCSPVEAVLFLPQNAPTATGPNVLISARLNLDTLDELKDILEELVETTPDLKILSHVTTEGYGILWVGILPIFLHYEPNTRTLLLMTGMTISEQVFRQTLNQLVPVAQHPMHAMENSVDSSRQGFFLWANVQRILPLVQSSIPPESLQLIRKWGLLETQSISLGWGVSSGKGRLKLMIDVPRAGYRQFIPEVSSTLSLTTSGKPGTIFCLSVLDLELLKGFETIARLEVEPKKYADYQNGKAAFMQKMGFSVEDVLQAFGPEIVFFTDAIGTFLAVGIRDAKQVRNILKSLVEKFGLAHEIRRVDRKEYNHLVIPSPFAAEDLPFVNNDRLAFLLKLSKRPKTHLYWMEDQGYLIFAQVPQVLIDRQHHKQRVPMGQYVSEHRRQDPYSSLLFFSTALSDTPRQLYYMYLQILNGLADLVQAKMDMFALPTAADLKLPTKGTYGIQLDLAGSALSLEFIFENNPLEFFLSRDITTIAKIGIASAVAIPFFANVAERARKPQKEQDQSKEQTFDMGNKKLSFKDLNGSFANSEKAGKLFIVKGLVTNNYPDKRSFIRIRSDTLDSKGKVVKSKIGYAGNPISDKELLSLSMEEIDNRLRNKLGKNKMNMNILPNSSIPLMIVFGNLPEDLSEFTVEPISSSAGIE